MSAIEDTRRMAERLVNTLGHPIAFESRSFTPTSEIYLRLQFLVRPPEDPVIGDKYYRERITFQVFVADQLGVGTGGAMAVAETIRALFFKGATFQEGSTRIYVLGTPQMSSSVVTADRLVIPVLIDLVAEVFN
jgi:Bacteriophage related domain of unknown function